MADEPRYTDEEVRRIFDEATNAQEPAGKTLAPREHGMTLAELKRIGAEVGIDPGRVERAARTLDVRRDARRQRMLGLPIGVGRTVELERRLSDREWEELVGMVRGTFNARGRTGGRGSFKRWTNGNLQVLLEPAGDAHRLRLRTVKGSARGLITGGGFLIALGIVALVASVIGSGGMWAPVQFLVTGTVLAGMGAVQVPGWAAERERQMEAVATQASLLASGAPTGDAEKES